MEMHIHLLGHKPKFSEVKTPPLFNGKSKGIGKKGVFKGDRIRPRHRKGMEGRKSHDQIR